LPKGFSLLYTYNIFWPKSALYLPSFQHFKGFQNSVFICTWKVFWSYNPMFFLLLPSSGFLHTFPLFHSCYFLSLDFTCREDMWHLSFYVWLISLNNIFFPLFIHMPINVTARSYSILIFSFLGEILSWFSFFTHCFYHFYIYLHVYTLFLPPPHYSGSPTPIFRHNLFSFFVLWICWRENIGDNKKDIGFLLV
jgi:hypothetical protein